MCVCGRTEEEEFTVVIRVQIELDKFNSANKIR